MFDESVESTVKVIVENLSNVLHCNFRFSVEHSPRVVRALQDRLKEDGAFRAEILSSAIASKI